VVRRWVAGALVVVAALAVASPAFAHVTLDPPSMPKGGNGTLTFVVPNEETSADTVTVDVQFPLDHPIPLVLVAPHAGWTATTQTTKLATPVDTPYGQVTEAVNRVTWTGGRIAPGQFDRFDVLVASLPTDVDALEFKVVQTYSNADVVRWIEDPGPGGVAPDHPAPLLSLTGPPSSAATTTAPTGPAGAAALTARPTSGDTTGPYVLAGVALAVAALALALSIRNRAAHP
jgi:uncharacterized protein YcnI